MAYLVALLLFIPFFALASSRAVAALRRFYDNRVHGGLLAAMLLIPYLFAALPLGRNDPGAFSLGLAKVIAYLAVPTALMLWRPASHKPLDLFDSAAILALWFPIEFDWLPDVSVTLAAGVGLPVAKLMGVDLAFLLFLVIRPLDGLGYSYRLSRKDFGSALLGLLAFALVGLPLGFAIRFIAFHLAPVAPIQWLLSLLAIYLLIGIPEELLFRGIIQNLIEQRFGRNGWTLAGSAILFGAAHLDNATPGHPVPNFAYMLMAALAGAAYGWVWRRAGKINASAVTHALVDWIWGVVLGG